MKKTQPKEYSLRTIADISAIVTEKNINNICWSLKAVMKILLKRRKIYPNIEMECDKFFFTDNSIKKITRIILRCKKTK